MSEILPDDSPAERRRQKVRTAILDAAERVFAKEGEAGLSIRRLAEEIDYSPAAIYKYFGSKEELVDELKESFFECLLSDIDEAAYTTLPFRERACHTFGKYIETAITRPHHYMAAFSYTLAFEGIDLASHFGDMDPEVFRASHKGRAFHVIAGLIEEGQATGMFRADIDPFLAAKSLWASMHGVAMLLIQLPGFPSALPTPHPDLTRPDFIRLHTELMFAGLCVPSSQKQSHLPRSGPDQ
ncbi:TetR/AcrR family transcriptional regulator [Hyphomonas sp.]|uniref:TetR/AcrR family transcriptional regulator n=1 Tax=Hyphomonas sp. TaxID=87 RepID=UPI00391CF625